MKKSFNGFMLLAVNKSTGAVVKELAHSMKMKSLYTFIRHHGVQTDYIIRPCVSL